MSRRLRSGDGAAANAGPARALDMAAVIVAEFDEMPGTKLTMVQVCRLWGLSRPDADRIIATLVDAGVLAVAGDGRVCRPHDLGR